MDSLLDANEVAQILKVSKRTFEALISQGKGPKGILIGRQRRWRAQDIEIWLNSTIDQQHSAVLENTLNTN